MKYCPNSPSNVLRLASALQTMPDSASLELASKLASYPADIEAARDKPREFVARRNDLQRLLDLSMPLILACETATGSTFTRP